MVRHLVLKWEGLFSEEGETKSLKVTKPPEILAPKRTVRQIFQMQRTQSGKSLFLTGVQLMQCFYQIQWYRRPQRWSQASAKEQSNFCSSFYSSFYSSSYISSYSNSCYSSWYCCLAGSLNEQGGDEISNLIQVLFNLGWLTVISVVRNLKTILELENTWNESSTCFSVVPVKRSHYLFLV